MKKLSLLLILVIVVLAIIVTACGNGGINEEHSFPPPLTRDQFLEDFDYLINTLEANFPYLGIIYRRNGVDMLELAEEIRVQISDENFNINYVTFWNLLSDNFFYHAWPIGHLWLVGHLEFSSHLDSFWFPFDIEVTRYFGNRLQSLPQNLTNYPLSTRIIEEGRIAYIRVPTFERLAAEGRRIDNFYSQLEGFEHLIIDLRGNSGGWPSQFDMYIAMPLIDHDLRTQFHHFFMDGQYSYNFFDRWLRVRGRQEIFDFNIESIANILPDTHLSPEVLEDLALMDFYFVEDIRVWSTGRARAPFYGKIWVLVDDRIKSGAVQVAAFYSDVGFATFVGEAGGGMPSSRLSSAYFSLPNTTFIVRFDANYFLDNTGHPLEYGFIPHYSNREGMDALETVLAMIKDSGY